ncbi:MAG: DUF2058 family protein [Proteobacteria bacterium]|nr:DUF2058 family protein [Pseudomonadota bacterium]
MTDSLRNQLMGLGFKPPQPEAKPARRPEDRPARKPDPKRARHEGQPQRPHERGRGAGAPAGGRNAAPARSGARPGQARPGQGKPRSREDIDLAKAYAIRAQREKDERIAAEKARQEEARQRREARAKLAELVKGKALNAADAEIARHFPYGGKIKRIHVTPAQLKSLNAGELGVLQMDGRYLLVTAELLAQAEQVFAPAVALKVDPDAPAEDDPYADPQYQVPDDLVW